MHACPVRWHCRGRVRAKEEEALRRTCGSKNIVAAGSALVLRSGERPDARALRNDDGNSAHKITGANAGGPMSVASSRALGGPHRFSSGVRQKTMSRFESITFREAESSDLETFYEHQLDPEAIRMAAFVCEDPKDKVAFDAHCDKIFNSSQITKRTNRCRGTSCWSHIVLSAGRKHRSHLLAWKGVLGKRISDSIAQ